MLGGLHRIIDRLSSYRIASIQASRVANLLPYQHKCLEAGRQAEGHKRLRQHSQESREAAPLSTMAFARSASGPAGLSINTGAANLLWVPSLSPFSLHFLVVSPAPRCLYLPSCIPCLYCDSSTHSTWSSCVHNLSAYIPCHVCAQSLSPSLSTFHSQSPSPSRYKTWVPFMMEFC